MSRASDSACGCANPSNGPRQLDQVCRHRSSSRYYSYTIISCHDLIVPSILLGGKRVGRLRGVRKAGKLVTTNLGTAPADRGSEDPLSLERQVCFALVVASRSVLSIYRPLLEPMGLTHPQYLVMLALWGERPLPVGKIGALLQLDSPTLSPLLKRLESAGLITGPGATTTSGRCSSISPCSERIYASRPWRSRPPWWPNWAWRSRSSRRFMVP